MQKKKIAVIFGGNSTEYEVSLQSAFSVFENINKEKFDIVPIGITRNGDWYHYTGKKEKIANNRCIMCGIMYGSTAHDVVYIFQDDPEICCC